jgi:hypothetical protein
MRKYTLTIQAHHVQLWGALLQTMCTYKQHRNIYSIIIAEYAERNLPRLLKKMMDGKPYTDKLRTSEALAIHTWVNNIDITESDRIYLNLLRDILAQLDPKVPRVAGEKPITYYELQINN